jgi:hypothetical protein
MRQRRVALHEELIVRPPRVDVEVERQRVDRGERREDRLRLERLARVLRREDAKLHRDDQTTARGAGRGARRAKC